MPPTPYNAALYAIVSAPPPATISEVIAVMEHMDGALPDDDGLKWFNRMYLMVTKEVDAAPPASGWRDPGWLLALDVVFAGFYLQALKNAIDGTATVPSSWLALLDTRFNVGIDRIQFALAGMNAHINHDLALALLAVDQQCGIIPAAGSPQHQDFEVVNDLLHNLMPAELTMLAVDTLGVAAQDAGKIGRLLAFWNLCEARELAWNFADHLRSITEIQREAALAVQDQMTGLVGRAILAFEVPPALET
jgi:hypothetical protein